MLEQASSTSISSTVAREGKASSVSSARKFCRAYPKDPEDSCSVKSLKAIFANLEWKVLR